MKRNLLVFLAGALFGAGLAVSGMTDPGRVVGFLDIAGDWDPTLAFVMGGALTVFSLGYFALRQRCSLPPSGEEPISKSLLTGAAVFGIGWGLGGFCPGPAIANLGALRDEAMIFVATMAIGTVLAQGWKRAGG